MHNRNEDSRILQCPKCYRKFYCSEWKGLINKPEEQCVCPTCKNYGLRDITELEEE